MGKWDQTAQEHLDEVKIPNASIGTCRNYRYCNQNHTDLANGYCIACWDRGLGSKPQDYFWKPTMLR